jgi:hypothetical protein
VEEEWLLRAYRNPIEDADGTCVAVAIVDGKTLTAASIGDSEMVLILFQKIFCVILVFNLCVGSMQKWASDSAV